MGVATPAGDLPCRSLPAAERGGSVDTRFTYPIPLDRI
ncbi:hypothetical protein BIWAKO_04229 [Bosea sp. BIWAKO-01]|nr:hypothetical protein BIWAKO_04229 [Bosea sp. BIWAKO-01]